MLMSASAATQTVSNNNDDGSSGSLRQTILNANPGDVIEFDGGVTGTITLISGQLLIDKDLTINGPGADDLAISGGGVFRVFETSGSVDVTISGLAIQDGFATAGGGINHQSNGTLTINDCIISNNTAERSGVARGGGVNNGNGGTINLNNCTITQNTANSTLQSGAFRVSHVGGVNNLSGNLNIDNCTISENEATTTFSAGTGSGGGVEVENGAATITNSTISDNTASDFGGGIRNTGTIDISNSTISGNIATERSGGGISNSAVLDLNFVTITLNSANSSISVGGGIEGNINSIKNTILANNTDNGSGPDCFGTLTSQGFNLIEDITGCSGTIGSDLTGVSADLEALADNNGSTQTHALGSNSFAIDAGDCGSVTTDQRGISRPQGSACDIGAFELEQVPVNQPPVAICQNLTVPANTNCEADVSPEDVDDGSFDPDEDDITFSISPEGPYPVGETEVTLTVTDENDESAQCNATITVTGGSGTIAGSVQAGGEGLAGVTVSLLDTSGVEISGFDPVVTDNQGEYEFTDVPPDTYLISIFEPLGYTAESNPIGDTLLACDNDVVDFNLDQEVVDNNSKPAVYWARQFRKNILGKGNPQESEQDLLDYIDEVHQHYDPHFTIFEDDVTLEDWWKKLRLWRNFTQYKRARRQLAALLMNMVSGKVAQYTVVTDDGRTAGEVLTYASQLLTDNDSGNDRTAKKLARKVNRRRIIAAGKVPASNILYKGAQDDLIVWGFSDGIPTEYTLDQNFPNPFNPTTTIRFALPEAATVSLKVYNIRGQLVRTLFSGIFEAGFHDFLWDATNDNGIKVSSGVYFYEIKTREFIQVKKMLLIE